MDSPFIRNYSALWWSIWGQISSLSFDANLMSCSRAGGAYLNEYDTNLWGPALNITQMNLTREPYEMHVNYVHFTFYVTL